MSKKDTTEESIASGALGDTTNFTDREEVQSIHANTRPRLGKSPMQRTHAGRLSNRSHNTVDQSTLSLAESELDTRRRSLIVGNFITQTDEFGNPLPSPMVIPVPVAISLKHSGTQFTHSSLHMPNAPMYEDSRRSLGNQSAVTASGVPFQAHTDGQLKTQGQNEQTQYTLGQLEYVNPSCCACLIKYVCCLSYDEIYSTAPLNGPSPYSIQIQLQAGQQPGVLLAPRSEQNKGKKCLVLDLDETLVHSSFVEIPGYDFSVELTFEGENFKVYVFMRPGVEEFLEELAKHYELVLFTASVATYAVKVTEFIDRTSAFSALLFREHCTFYRGVFVKDLSRLNRNLEECIIVDNSPLSYQLQPENAIGCKTFTTNKADSELFYMKDFLIEMKDVSDVRKELPKYNSYLARRIASETDVDDMDTTLAKISPIGTVPGPVSDQSV